MNEERRRGERVISYFRFITCARCIGSISRDGKIGPCSSLAVPSLIITRICCLRFSGRKQWRDEGT